MSVDLDLMRAGDVTLVTLDARSLNELNVESVGEQLFNLAVGMEDCVLLLDFAAVDYLDSLGLAKVVALHRRVLKARGRLVLRGVQPQVREVFQVTGLDDALDIR